MFFLVDWCVCMGLVGGRGGVVDTIIEYAYGAYVGGGSRFS